MDFRLVNGASYLPFIWSDHEAKQIVKSKGRAALEFAAHPRLR
jgi:hypothetical protein